MNDQLVTDSRTAAKKMSAMDSLVVLEKEFATLRDRYDNRRPHRFHYVRANNIQNIRREDRETQSRAGTADWAKSYPSRIPAST